jgi:hypothetical protein
VLAGNVISQNPAGGTSAQPGTAVDLVVSANLPPLVTEPADQTVAEGSLLVLNIQATDPNIGQSLTYSLGLAPPGVTLNSTTGELRWTPPDGPTTEVITVRVTDDAVPALSSTATFNVTVTNVAPSLQISGPATIVPGESFVLSLSATDPGADTISQWVIDWGDSVQIVSGSPASVQHVYATAGNYTISAQASDEDGTYASNSLTLQANTPPTVQNPGNRQSTLNVAVNLQIIAADADAGDTIAYAARGLPNGLSIDAQTGLISGRPSKNGNYSVVVTVTDSRNASASVSFSWSITKKSTTPAPTVNLSAQPGTIAPGASSTLSWSTSNASSCVAENGWSGTRPTSGSELVTPTATTTYVLVCTGPGGSTTGSVTVVVTANSPPSFIDPPGPRSGTVGDVVNLPISASDPAGDPLNFSATGLPPDLSITPTSPSSAVISGTLLAAGVWTVLITVDDGAGGTASTGFSWTVSGTSNSAPVVTNPGEQKGVRGQSASLQIQATDVDGDPLSYSATALPSGLAIDSATGLISGVYSSNGNTTTTVTVSDGKGGVGSVSFLWSVRRK